MIAKLDVPQRIMRQQSWGTYHLGVADGEKQSILGVGHFSRYGRAVFLMMGAEHNDTGTWERIS